MHMWHGFGGYIFHVISYTCAFAVIKSQTVGCRNGQLISVNNASRINLV